MGSNFLYPIIGLCFLLFRVWIAEIRLRDILKEERQYMSRIFSYYLAAMLIYNFQNMTFNLLVVGVLPYMIISLGWDAVFFKNLNSVEEYKGHRFWLSIERLTTHVPMIIAGIIPFFFDIKTFVIGGLTTGDPGIVFGFIYAMVLLFGPITILDVRFAKRTIWKTALGIFFGGLFFSIMWGILIFIVWDNGF